MEDVLVIDAGSCTFRAGRKVDFPSDSDPRVITPSVVEVCKDSQNDRPPQITQIHDADSNIENWDGYEAVVSHILYEQLGWPEGDEGNLITTETPFTSRQEREGLTQMMFETFNVTGYYVLDAMVASLYAYGKIHGVAVDMGHTGTIVAQVTDGALQLSSVERFPIGGAALNKHLRTMLAKRSLSLTDTQLATLQERCATAAESAEWFDSIQSGGMEGETAFELPDGQVVSISTEGHELAELLLRPDAVLGTSKGQSVLGIAEATYACAMLPPDVSVRKNYLNNIVLCGGCANIPNLSQRVMRELRALLPATASATILSVPEYMSEKTTQYAAFMGASVVSTLIGPAQIMQKADYEECGPAGIHRKC